MKKPRTTTGSVPFSSSSDPSLRCCRTGGLLAKLALLGLGMDRDEFLRRTRYYPSSRVLGAVIGANQGDEQLCPSIACDVTLQFSYFDPPYYSVNNQGHNLAPHNSGSTTTEQATWYLIDKKGDGTESRLFGSYDFRKMFAKAS